MRSHFLMSGAATACALSAATAIMPSVCSAQIATDGATDPTYSGGWSAGQNGGSGFGAWSFNGTDPTPAGTYQGMTTSSPLGTSWTLFTHANNSGLANAGRGISEVGGLQPGQTLETVIDNPTAFNFYRGFDMLFTSGPDNTAPGNNTAALRLSVFNYGTTFWHLNDSGSVSTGLSPATTGAAGMRLDLTLTSATAYSLTLTPLNGATPYTHAGTLAGGPITWVDFRLWDGVSAGPNDTANNFEISSMTITVPEPSTLALIGLGAGGLIFLRRRK
ncbi:MAG TPA: PEP-CTERM sorting domain-containing protein [Candidatus Acidoferrum sp.]|nr:PEP-CTERM sorting domain-containing protein [Candidatus Acidoferrum sp.]